MKLTTAIVLSLNISASLVAAFVIPANLTDGTYQHSVNERGEDVFELLTHKQLPGLFNSRLVRREPEPELVSLVMRTASSGTHCGCGYKVDRAKTDSTWKKLKKQVGSDGSRIPQGKSWFSIEEEELPGGGSVVSFICNTYGQSGDFVVTTSMMNSAGSQITANCGSYIAGTQGFNQASNWPAGIGYMQWKEGLDFCKHAFDSNTVRC